jgi:hypothetical protein
LDGVYEFFGNSVLNCIYGSCLLLGLAYAIVLMMFQWVDDIIDTSLFHFGGGLDHGGHDAHDGSGLSLLAIAGFISAFGAFGLAGLAFESGAGGSLIIAMLGGIIVGGLGQAFFVYVLSPTTSAVVNQSHLAGMIAEVITPIPVNGMGQVMLVAQGSRVSYGARAYNNQAIPRGTEVRIEKIIGSVVTVVPTSEFEA